MLEEGGRASLKIDKKSSRISIAGFSRALNSNLPSFCTLADSVLSYVRDNIGNHFVKYVKYFQTRFLKKKKIEVSRPNEFSLYL